jgi:serine/threonine protein kinase
MHAARLQGYTRSMLPHASADKTSIVQVDSNGMLKPVADSSGRVPRAGSRPLSSILRHLNPGFVDLMSAMLQWDPAMRITPEEAKQHPWILETEDPQSQDSGSARVSHHEQIKASTAGADTRSIRGPLTEAGNVQHTHATKGHKRSDRMHVKSMQIQHPGAEREFTTS